MATASRSLSRFQPRITFFPFLSSLLLAQVAGEAALTSETRLPPPLLLLLLAPSASLPTAEIISAPSPPVLRP